MGDDLSFEIALFPGGFGWIAAVWDYENGLPPEGHREDRWNPDTYTAIGNGDTPESALADLPEVYRTHDGR